MCVCVKVRSLDTQMSPERLKVITQQVEEEQAILQSQTLLRLQQIHAAERQTHSPQVRNIHTFEKTVGISVYTTVWSMATECVLALFKSLASSVADVCKHSLCHKIKTY